MNPHQIVLKGKALLHTIQQLKHMIKEQRTDLIDAHGSYASVLAGLVGACMRIPRVVTFYDLNVWASWKKRPLGQLALGLASVIVTDSRVRSGDIQRWMLRPKPRLCVIPNGTFAPTTTHTRDQMRQRFGLPQNPQIKVIGQISQLVSFKGQTVLLDAARTVLTQVPNAVFLIVGYPREDTTYREDLEKQAADLGIQDKVRICSYPGPIGDVWQAIDIHVHPTLHDSLPNAIIEGMSLAKPAVVTSVGGIPDLVDHERTGLRVPPGDPEALSLALLHLLHQPAYAQQLGAAARRRYREGYRPDVIARQLENLFVDLIGPSNSVTS